MENDTYKTIENTVKEVVFKDKSSKFLGYAFPVINEQQIKDHIETLKKEHFSARHWCYAWQLGKEQLRYRANDDGEPSGTAGLPIYGQIQSFELTNVLVVVVRYFGGIKLGVGGLVNAYRTTAQLTLQEAQITECTIDVCYEIQFEYKDMNKVMKIIKDTRASIQAQDLTLSCVMKVSLRKLYCENFERAFEPHYEIAVKRI